MEVFYNSLHFHLFDYATPWKAHIFIGFDS